MIKSPPKVAYIIVSWNNKSLLDECIDSIANQDYGNKAIILVDNNSSDGTVEYVKSKYPQVTLLPQSQNLGFAEGNNKGISKALEDSETKFIVLLNTDARIAPNWTTTLVSASSLRPRAATLQSVTLDYYDHNTIDSTHIYISRIGQGTQGAWRSPLPQGYDIAPQKVFGCNAAAMMITRSFIEAQPFEDMFDRTMYMYLEDVDLATRATVMGWDNFAVPGTRAYHMGSVSSLKKDPSFSIYMTYRNNLGLLIKNLPAKVLIKIIVKIPQADRGAIKHLKRIGRDEAIPYLIKGRIFSLFYLPVFIYKRAKLSHYRKINPDYLWYLMRRGF